MLMHVQPCSYAPVNYSLSNYVIYVILFPIRFISVSEEETFVLAPVRLLSELRVFVSSS